MEVLTGLEGVTIVSMHNSDIVRNSLVQKIVEAYERRDRKGDTVQL